MHNGESRATSVLEFRPVSSHKISQSDGPRPFPPYSEQTMPLSLPPKRRLISYVFAFGLALLGGFVAQALHLPLPWMLGALVVTAVLAMTVPQDSGLLPPPSNRLRNIFIGVIGVMIGGNFTPDLVSAIGEWWLTLLAMVVVTLALQFAGYLWLRHGIGLDRATAYFSASPGGLMENIVMGEAHQGDVRIISALHFMRIVLLVLLFPFAYSIWMGGPVGSAAGFGMGNGAALTMRDGALLIATGVAGQIGAAWLRIPAGMIVGPLVLSALTHATGVVHGQVPGVIVAMAQWIIGTTLGLRFAGLPRAQLLPVLRAALVAMAISVSVVLIVVALIVPYVSTGPAILILSFVPGGLAEMGLIALSLGADPVFVTAHHVFRILIAVIVTPRLFRLIAR